MPGRASCGPRSTTWPQSPLRGGVFAFEVGEVRKGSLLLDRVVADVARETSWEPFCIVLNKQVFTKTSNAWGVDNNRGGTNSNRIVIMRRR